MQTSLQNYRVLVTPTSYAKYDPTLKTRLEEEVGEVIYNPSNHPLPVELLIDLIQDVDGYIAGLDEVTNDVLAIANKLKVIARYGVGVDNINLKAAARTEVNRFLGILLPPLFYILTYIVDRFLGQANIIVLFFSFDTNSISRS